MDLEYVHIHVICRVNQADYSIRIPMAAPQEDVNNYSTSGVRIYRHSRIYKYIYIYIYVCVCVCIHIHTHTHTYICSSYLDINICVSDRLPYGMAELHLEYILRARQC